MSYYNRRSGSSYYGNSSYGNGNGGQRSAEVYTDGSCPNNGRDGARGGVGVYWGDNDPRNVSRGLSDGRQTNNRAEIEAARTALDQARSQGYSDVTIKTDSEFLVKSANDWMPRWKENGWKTYSGNPVANREEFQQMDRAAQGMNVRYEHVPGHKGVHGNEMADDFARRGAYNKY